MDVIKLNDILKIESLGNVKIRFNTSAKNVSNPIEFFKNNDMETLLVAHYWNSKEKKAFQDGQTTIGFVRINERDGLWLLFHIGRITNDLNKYDSMGYEYQTLDEYSKYFGRLIIRFKNTVQNMIRNADAVMGECEVVQLLPDRFDDDIFPGYDKVNLTWAELARNIEKESWITALQNQKGVYLISDVSNGKIYVGSAYGENMILGRWQSYVRTGHGGNVELKKLDFEHIKSNFTYTILDIYKSSTDDHVILERESWWKEVLQSRKHGNYNSN